ncbi:hypothetical protein [Mesorhizobium amorphae]|uniref:hypothetical protein n=1 Tax=Mesorhizobium amorphae TaxID=71433 RepID=UPI0021B1D79C|nr:hypothetical protein [Mesorhizobium amorphae]
MMPKTPKSVLEQMAEEQTDAYLHRSTVAFLECAIHLMMSHMSQDEVVKILRAEADLLEEHG